MKRFLRGLSILIGCAVALHFSTLRAQDDNAAPAAAPAPADNGGDTTGANAATGPTADTPTGAVSNDSATFQTFYDGLAGEGTWIQTQQFGYAWQPRVTDPNWAPYTDGYWVYSDQGWMWVSNEPWGWATYHYGRWANLDGIGWVWVPGYQWAPAWVSWRNGDGNAGWAPLPPDSMVGTDYAEATTPANPPDMGDSGANPEIDDGYHIGGDSDDYYGIGAGWYVFLPIIYFCHHDYHGHYCHHGDNYWIINRTHNVTNINVGHGTGPGHFHRVTVGGPSLAEINAASDTPMQKVNLVQAAQPGGGKLDGNTVSIYAPHIHAAASAAPPRVGMSVGQARLNRGIDVTRPLVVNSSLLPAAPTTEQIEKAHQAQSAAPPAAKVLTDANAVKPVMHGPVSMLKPIAAAPEHTTTFTNGVEPGQRQVFNPQTHTFPQAGGQPIYAPTPSNEQHTTITGGNGPHAPRATTPGPGGGTSAGGSHVYARPEPEPSTTESAPVTRGSSSSTPSSRYQDSTSTTTSSSTPPASGAPVSSSGAPVRSR